MSFEARMTISIHGRDFGLQNMSSVGIGSTFSPRMIVGPEAVRQNVSTGETTAEIFRPYGISVLSTGSSAVHVLAPPIPGVEKTLYSSGGATAFVKTRNDETIESSLGSTFTTLRFVAGVAITLVGLTTARWLGLNLTSGTSSQGAAVTQTTST